MFACRLTPGELDGLKRLLYSQLDVDQLFGVFQENPKLTLSDLFRLWLNAMSLPDLTLADMESLGREYEIIRRQELLEARYIYLKGT